MVFSLGVLLLEASSFMDVTKCYDYQESLINDYEVTIILIDKLKSWINQEILFEVTVWVYWGLLKLHSWQKTNFTVIVGKITYIKNDWRLNKCGDI